jgi:hypothetical protein
MQAQSTTDAWSGLAYLGLRLARWGQVRWKRRFFSSVKFAAETRRNRGTRDCSAKMLA